MKSRRRVNSTVGPSDQLRMIVEKLTRGVDDFMVRISSITLPVLIALVFIGASTTSAQTEVLNLGGVIISVSDSRTAQVFHIVDQMSQWDSGVHHGYVRWATRTLNLRPEDQELLQKHADLRRAR